MQYYTIMQEYQTRAYKKAELVFGAFLVPSVSVFGTWKRVIRFRYFGTFLKQAICYRYFGRHCISVLQKRNLDMLKVSNNFNAF